MNCVHCDEALGKREYYYMTQRIPIHTACIGYADANLLATLFDTPPHSFFNQEQLMALGSLKGYRSAEGGGQKQDNQTVLKNYYLDNR